MSNNSKLDLSNIKEADVYYIASALLYVLKDDPKYQVLSEIFYLLDYNNFIKLIKYYGGETVKFPTSEEVTEVLKLLLLYKYYRLEKLKWDDALAKSGLDKQNSKSLIKKLESIEKHFGQLKVGGRNYR